MSNRGNLHSFSGQILGLWGYARTGKDTVCKTLGWPRASMGDCVRSDLQPLFADLPLYIDQLDVHREAVRPVQVAYAEFKRAIDGEYWMNRVVIPPGMDKVCFTDCRSLGDVAPIWRKRGLVVYLERPGVGPRNDTERTSFRAIWKFVAEQGLQVPIVMNDGTPEDAAKKVLGLLQQHYQGCKI